ncbi:MAG TPA: carboxypeptidase regulatory-like domain-containing protein, partial [Chitinophagaceae bacterium]|nr:carboxypeptidase regulatory-like domain-containing protein [Chitinophagaceae bacterium]
MRHLYLQILFLLVFAGTTTIAQSGFGKISGIIQSSKDGINGATVGVLKLKDSSIVKMGVGDNKGMFEIERLPQGNYFLQVTAVGYASYFSKPFTVTGDKQSQIIPTIELVKAVTDLHAVTVRVTRPLVEN